MVTPPTFRFSSTPTPPVVTIKAPVSFVVDVVLSVTVTLPDDRSAAKMVLATPRPPTTFKAPVVVSVAFVPSQTLVTPPTFRFSSVLIPPATLRAPVVTEVEVVSSVRVTTPEAFRVVTAAALDPASVP